MEDCGMVSSEVNTEDLAAISNYSAQRQPDEDDERDHSRDIVDEQISSPTSIDSVSEAMTSALMLKKWTERMNDLKVWEVVSGIQELCQTRSSPPRRVRSDSDRSDEGEEDDVSTRDTGVPQTPGQHSHRLNQKSGKGLSGPAAAYEQRLRPHISRPHQQQRTRTRIPQYPRERGARRGQPRTWEQTRAVNEPPVCGGASHRRSTVSPVYGGANHHNVPHHQTLGDQ